jgi:hypothetical protein
MRRIISFLIGFLFLLTPILSQKADPVERNVSSIRDTIFLNIGVESPKVLKANDNVALRLAQSIENQSYIADNLAASIEHISESLRGYLDNAFGPLIIGQKEVLLEYGISTEQVKKSIKLQNIFKLIFAGSFFIPIYLLLSSRRQTFLGTNIDGYKSWWSVFLKESLRWFVLIMFLYILTTLVFNSLYYDIIILSKLLL